jgi:hypothetical protein
MEPGGGGEGFGFTSPAISKTRASTTPRALATDDCIL